MSSGAIIPVEVVKSITGATDDAVATKATPLCNLLKVTCV